MKMKVQLGLAGMCVVLLFATAGYGQHRPRAEDAARRYNEGVQPIYEEIDSLRQKLGDSTMSMSDAAKIIDQQSALRGKADQLWSSTQAEIDNAYRQTREDINNYNADNRRLEYESAILGSRGDVLNNVGKYPNKEAFETNKPNLSADWEKNYGSRLKPFGEEWAKQKEEFFARYKEKYGVDLNAEGYSRIGSVNPYTGQVNYKYYGPDGNLIAAQWKNDAEGYEKAQQDFDAARSRQQERQTALKADEASLKKFDSEFQQSRASGQQGLASLEKSVRRIDFAGLWRGRDNVGNWLVLRLNRDGTTHYSWGKSATEYSNSGTWQQTGSRITMQTDDGEWRHQSTITTQNQLEFIEIHADGRRYTNYLTRQ
jgi:hypothetical protein